MPIVTDQMLANQQRDMRDAIDDLIKIALRLRESHDALLGVVKDGLSLTGGWREAVVELEDWCHEPVRLKNMVAAADQLDAWADAARAAVAAAETV